MDAGSSRRPGMTRRNFLAAGASTLAGTCLLTGCRTGHRNASGSIDHPIFLRRVQVGLTVGTQK
jgi:hypothetical protein